MLTGELLKEARNDLGFTQKRLAIITGIDQVQISRYENGQIPEFDNLCKICTALCMSIEQFRKVHEDSKNENL